MTYMTASMRAAHIDWIISFEPNFTITLGAGLSCTPDRFRSAATQFFNEVQRDKRKRNWHKFPAAGWPVAVGFIEKPDSNMHMHIIARIPPDLWAPFADAGPTWKNIRPGGDYWTLKLESPERYARYVTKEHWRADFFSETFIYGPRQIF